MLATPKQLEGPMPETGDRYLGFEIAPGDRDDWVAIPGAWHRGAPIRLVGCDRPRIRERIWSWWHRLQD